MKNDEKGDIDPITLKRGSNNRRQKGGENEEKDRSQRWMETQEGV